MTEKEHLQKIYVSFAHNNGNNFWILSSIIIYKTVHQQLLNRRTSIFFTSCIVWLSR